MKAAASVVVVTLIAAFCAASFVNALELRSLYLPIAFATAMCLSAYVFRNSKFDFDNSTVTKIEWGVIFYAAIVSIIRVVPYGFQYLREVIVAAVTWDDNWHFQELASLVNTDRFPPRLNFHPDVFLHFYYAPWVFGAVLSDFFVFLFGSPMIKLTYGLNTVFLNVVSSTVLVIFLRHIARRSVRKFILLAGLLAGSVPDGLFAIFNLAHGTLTHSEWWQEKFGVGNQFSMWTTLLIWVPHHLVAAAAFLLAIVVATEPITLSFRPSYRAQAGAGLLLGFSLFSSVFVFLGGLFAILPLMVQLRRTLRFAIAGAALASLFSYPLIYIYLHSYSGEWFIFFDPFNLWKERFNSWEAGMLGTIAALIFMVGEVGWAAIIPAFFQKTAEKKGPLDHIAIASSTYLVSTALISFGGSNNYAMRGSILPIIFLCAFFGERVALGFAGTLGRPLKAIVLGCIAVAVIAHINEILVYAKSSEKALAYDSETAACKNAILKLNATHGPVGDDSSLAVCQNELSEYSVERPFMKSVLNKQDRELAGPGP